MSPSGWRKRNRFENGFRCSGSCFFYVWEKWPHGRSRERLNQGGSCPEKFPPAVAGGGTWLKFSCTAANRLFLSGKVYFLCGCGSRRPLYFGNNGTKKPASPLCRKENFTVLIPLQKKVPVLRGVKKSRLANKRKPVFSFLPAISDITHKKYTKISYL